MPGGEGWGPNPRDGMAAMWGGECQGARSRGSCGRGRGLVPEAECGEGADRGPGPGAAVGRGRGLVPEAE